MVVGLHEAPKHYTYIYVRNSEVQYEAKVVSKTTWYRQNTENEARSKKIGSIYDAGNSTENREEY
jgi:hypothetical protein